ncbi:hypothetical protein EKO04_004226 [Ascochyta lentis]|uniref:Uncharacterized protein n=1 Tax=Ascochyta lentis TaxID=205686 RepID=A0A8H7J8P9_9PLEO|nr:hypothetical protein EKO04_004226 [Ascochyta lentis]
MVSDGDQYPTTQPAKATYPDNALRNNSKGRDLDKEALERFKIREICEGWGVYRDAAEYIHELVWKASADLFYTLLFDKDKFVPVNPEKTFHIPEEEVRKYPSGYRYLAWAESKIGSPPKMNLNSHGPERDVLYGKCKAWVEGKEIVPDLTGNDIAGWTP